MDLARAIRDVPDFPKPGILFKDITTLLQDPAQFRETVERLAAPWRGQKIDVVCGIESRGFILGGALAERLGAGFVPARKPGKLPAKTCRVEYALEYGTDALEMHEDAVKKGQRVLICDDLVATGGTAKAAAELVEQLGATVAGFAILVNLKFLPGAKVISRWPAHYVVEFD
ncbi:MAG: adenine phosphoribosyltransferase [bacterium]